MNTHKIIGYSIIIALYIASLLFINKAIKKHEDVITELTNTVKIQSEEISELRYKLLNCKLNTINEIEGNKLHE